MFYFASNFMGYLLISIKLVFLFSYNDYRMVFVDSSFKIIEKI